MNETPLKIQKTIEPVSKAEFPSCFHVFVSCSRIYRISTSKPGICFLNSNNMFVGVVVFVHLWSDEEVDET